MALVDSFEKSGNWLFRYRGQIPVILFVAAIPMVYFTDTSFLSKASENIITIISISISLLGFIIRAISIGTTPAGTSGRNTREGQVAETLNTKGIYSMVRHPLYLGNYFMWIGIVIVYIQFLICDDRDLVVLVVLRKNHVCRRAFPGKKIWRHLYELGPENTFVSAMF